jgi:hypothetical protein
MAPLSNRLRSRRSAANAASARGIRGMVLDALRAPAGLMMPLVVGLFGLVSVASNCGSR